MHARTHTHTSSYLFLESTQLLGSGVLPEKAFDGDLAVPVALEHLTHWTTPH